MWERGGREGRNYKCYSNYIHNHIKTAKYTKRTLQVLQFAATDGKKELRDGLACSALYILGHKGIHCAGMVLMYKCTYKNKKVTKIMHLIYVRKNVKTVCNIIRLYQTIYEGGRITVAHATLVLIFPDIWLPNHVNFSTQLLVWHSSRIIFP